MFLINSSFFQTGLPSGYSHFHPPVSYPQVPSYSPFGGVPSYGGYPPGMPQRPMPGPMQHHMGMMPPGPMMPRRVATPPGVPPMPMTRSRTPSPETVLPNVPVTSSSNSGDVKTNEALSKSTSQQGTQTVSTKKKPSSRPSSRKNSVDKTEQPPQEKKKQEGRVAKDTTNKENDNKETAKKETAKKETAGVNQTAQPQRQRQGIELGNN